jgi:D-inositol-3-phosphate glycosyltransferase
MNIAMVSLTTSPLATDITPHESVRVHIAELATELGRAGNKVTVYTQRTEAGGPDQVQLAPGVTVEFISSRPLSDGDLIPHVGEFAARLARRFTANRPDVVHAHHWISGLAAIGGAKGLDIPVVQSFHGLAASPGTRARMEKAIGRGVTALITTTESECDGLVRLGVPRKQIATVPSGVDTEAFAPNGPAMLPESETPRILMVSRRFDPRDVATVVAALPRIPEAELVVAGGPSRDGLDEDPAVRRLRSIAAEAGVAERVTFLGQVDHADVPALLRSGDLTVSVPAQEEFGRVPVESMACGTPVIVSAVGGHLDSVIHDVTGVFAQPGRPVELARRIRGLLADRTRLTAMGIGGVDRARSRYSWERIANETVKVYKSVCHGPEQDAVEDTLDKEELAA